MKTSKGILGLVVGLVVGATAGILLAPEKGSTTRKKIKTKSKETKEMLKDNFDDFLDAVSEKYSSLKNDAENLIHKEKEEIKEKVKKA
tara:strand:+ start:1097 stop:1360 length:264 start_codon:yes stop_codon:yes gene_type:complete